MKKYLILNGANINLLGMREKCYGTVTLPEIEEKLKSMADDAGAELEFYQSNHEGDLIDKLQETRGKVDGVVFNPGGYTFTSVSLRDAITACNHRVIEVHLTNLSAREEFRHNSLISDVSIGQVNGLGADVYYLALKYFLDTDLKGDK